MINKLVRSSGGMNVSKGDPGLFIFSMSRKKFMIHRHFDIALIKMLHKGRHLKSHRFRADLCVLGVQSHRDAFFGEVIGDR